VSGGLITAVIGIVMMPWKLMATAGSYVFTWLIGYSGLMGAIGGIMICDYWVLRRRRLSLPDLFDPDGRYAYSNGINWRAVAALLIAICPCVPGFLDAATGGKIPAPTFLKSIYTYAWFVTFGTAFALYYVLMKSSRSAIA
jgi:nucleobase:cation symporter-1, NCS1 family